MLIVVICFYRYGADSLPKIPECKHHNYLECKTLKMCDVKAFHNLFYNKKDKLYQDAIIYKYCTADKPKKSRTRDNTRGKKRLHLNTAFGKLMEKRRKFVVLVF